MQRRAAAAIAASRVSFSLYDAQLQCQGAILYALAPLGHLARVQLWCVLCCSRCLLQIVVMPCRLH
jgi:hypothetical protein